MSDDQVTEAKIFDAARKVFYQRGYEGARMQEIADEAGINKAMLHYYYRSKDKLFQKVFQAGIKEVMPQIFGIMGNEIPLFEKIRAAIAFYHDTFRKNPHLPMFVIHEMQQHPDRFRDFMAEMQPRIPEIFLTQINEAVQSGKLRPITPQHLIVSILSMSMYPFIAKGMISIVMNMDESRFNEFIDEREELVPDLIFHGIIPRNGERS